LHDIPKGSFVATYSGQIFRFEDTSGDDDFVGDTYLAEIDFLQVRFFGRSPKLWSLFQRLRI
jgi:hypothetical protein